MSWRNDDNRTQYIIADDAKSDFGNAIADRGPDDQARWHTFIYTFSKPGRYGYHGNGFHETVIVLPDPYQAMKKKMHDSRLIDIDLHVYGSLDLMLAGHFAKGYTSAMATKNLLPIAR